MRDFTKPVVVVSKCIEFDAVRFDGQIMTSDLVRNLKPLANFIPVCPEMEIGLGVPRETVRIVKIDEVLRLIQPATGLDLTDRINRFSRDFLEALPEVDGFILKSRSPSSAMKDAKIYPSTGRVSSIGKGPGFFGRVVLDKFGYLAVEDENRLLNSRIKEHFLTKLYTLADFRDIKNSGSVNKLISFQARNKLLLTAYSQKELHIMGRIVAQTKDKPLQEAIAEFQGHLWKALRRPPRRSTNVNVLTKAAGYFKNKLSKNEKAFFLDVVEKYSSGQLPLGTPLNVLKAWIIRFKEEYLMQQTFFEPYPEILAETNLSLGDKDKDYWK